MAPIVLHHTHRRRARSTAAGMAMLGVTVTGVLGCNAGRGDRVAESGPREHAVRGDRGVAPAALYAELFSPGATFHLRGREETSGPLQGADPSTPTGPLAVTCMVADVSAEGDLTTSVVDCDPHVDVQGHYAATTDGLYRLFQPAAHASDVPRVGVLLLAPLPVGHREQKVRPDGVEEQTAVERRGDGWCWDHSVGGADRVETTVCFARGGLSRFETSFAGAASRKLVLARED